MNARQTEKWHLRLYVSEDSEKTDKATLLLKQICYDHLAGQCEIEIIDIKENPKMAVKDNIIATPCLIKLQPEPAKRIIGNLSDKKKILKGLEIEDDESDRT